MNIVTESRLGKFKITKNLIEDADEEILLVFSKIIIIRCEFMYPDLFEYRGYSKMFESLKVGDEIPEYLISFTKKETGEITFSAKKIND